MSHREGLKLILFGVVFGVALGHVVQWELRDIVSWIGILAFTVLLFIPVTVAQSWRERQWYKIADEVNGDLAPEDQVDPNHVPNRYLPWYLKDLTPYGIAISIFLVAAIFLLELIRGT